MQTEHMLSIRRQETQGCVLEVMEYQKLLGNPQSASEMYYREKQGIRLKTLRATLSNGKLLAEPGQLQYMKGHIELKVESGGGVGGFLQRAVSAALTGETVFKTEYTGTGTIFLEPTWKHYLLLDLVEDLIIDRGIFVAGAGNLQFSIKRPDSILGNALSGEGMFQTLIRGSGIVALYTPVPEAEIMIAELNNEKLVVDGNFALARTGGVRMTVQKSSKGILASAQSGEGLVTVFEGTGQVWLTPTVGMY
ncbi:transcriptional regulator [Deinococcus cellulosilyticus NBRC 106333 = KACC 11606]|uniref:Transcriptional regulator n=2 Tax=Deinococcus cellulosilyticus TaxID=401558 RepID=A0A511NAP2_DEIC1|nr:transcriptional regulator [Deinococcus cellulosilyticus NBRC 106333 = KACC 11606]